MSLTETDIAAIRKALSELAFHQYLRPGEEDKLIAGFEKAPMKKDEILITQGRTGEIFYVLASGKVGVFLKGSLVDKKIATLEPPAYFGEMSLVSNEPRTASVICEEAGDVYTLLRTTFRDVILDNPHVGDLIRKTAAERKAATKAIEYQEWMGKRL
jgi:CRP-like cAMP-binding protein